MLAQPKHPNFNPLQLTTPYSRCSSTGSIQALGASLTLGQSSGFELLKLARGNQVNKDLDRRRRYGVLFCCNSLLIHFPVLLVGHRQVLLQVTDLVNEDAADLNICDKYDLPLVCAALSLTCLLHGWHDRTHVVLLQEQRLLRHN